MRKGEKSYKIKFHKPSNSYDVICTHGGEYQTILHRYSSLKEANDRLAKLRSVTHNRDSDEVIETPKPVAKRIRRLRI